MNVMEASESGTGERTARETLAALERWSAFGGVWRVLDSDARSASVSLRRCDGGEEVERLVTEDAVVLEYLAAHPSSAD